MGVASVIGPDRDPSLTKPVTARFVWPEPMFLRGLDGGWKAIIDISLPEEPSMTEDEE